MYVLDKCYFDIKDKDGNIKINLVKLVDKYLKKWYSLVVSLLTNQ